LKRGTPEQEEVYRLRLEGLSWTQIGEVMGKTPEAVRSQYKRYMARLQAKEELEESKVKGEISYYKKELERLKKRVLSQEEILSLLSEEAFKKKIKTKLPPFRKIKENKDLPKRDILLLISDIHAGLIVSPEKVFGGNYSWEVLKERIKRYEEAVVKTLRDLKYGHNLEECFILFLGDLVEGHDVYSGQAYNLDKKAIEQVFYLCEEFEVLFYNLFNELRELGVKKIKIFAVSGNHGYIRGRKGEYLLELNFDYAFYLFLKKICSLRGFLSKDLRFEIAKTPNLYFESKGSTFQICHGEELRGWAGFPYYGLDRYEARTVKFTEVLHDYFIAGHWHHSVSLSSGRGKRIFNGCWVGATDFTQRVKLPSFPSQLVLLNSSNYGITHEINIALSEFKKPEVKIW